MIERLSDMLGQPLSFYIHLYQDEILIFCILKS